jgi:hypothetical protein
MGQEIAKTAEYCQKIQLKLSIPNSRPGHPVRAIFGNFAIAGNCLARLYLVARFVCQS